MKTEKTTQRNIAAQPQTSAYEENAGNSGYNAKRTMLTRIAKKKNLRIKQI